MIPVIGAWPVTGVHRTAGAGAEGRGQALR
jgi:hypothetical protein